MATFGAITFVVLVSFFAWVIWASVTAKREAQQEARRLRVDREVVDRQVPRFASNNHFVELVSSRCVRYQLRCAQTTCPAWQLLQRSNDEANLPNGWSVRADAQLPSHVATALQQVARDWSEEYLEIEFDGAAVLAFWQEGGGAEGVRKVHGYLVALCNAITHGPPASGGPTPRSS